MPDVAAKMKIFDIHTSKMTLDSECLQLSICKQKEDLSGADIKAMCSEAGMIAFSA